MESIQSQINSLHQALVKQLCEIREFPEDFLPHTVFVEEEDIGGVIYRQYKLTQIQEDGKCTLEDIMTNEKDDDRRLEEVNIDWLITLWIRYEELIFPKIPVLIPQKELYAFLFPAERFERNTTDDEIVSDYEVDEGQDPCTEKLTPDELAAMLNDGEFNNQNMYVRFIKH